VQTALAGLRAYDKENAGRTDEKGEPVEAPNWIMGSVAAVMLLLFFSVTVITDSSVAWFASGSADARGILAGDLWRTVTALTLHGDIVHAVSNAFATTIFLGALSGVLGAGLATAATLLAGAAGNLVNAFLQGPPHVAVGASTAVFGAVGILGGFAMVNQRSRVVGGRRAWVPVVAALALLAMLGTGGARVDIWAHLFGFVLGGALGGVIGYLRPHQPGSIVQWISGSGALGVIIYCWTLALR